LPGIKVRLPSASMNAKALEKVAIRDDRPVLFLGRKRLYIGTAGPLPLASTLQD
jgi:pyruvate/2-oxoglutarate/acetoin dehydrogenase E1 component